MRSVSVTSKAGREETVLTKQIYSMVQVIFSNPEKETAHLIDENQLEDAVE